MWRVWTGRVTAGRGAGFIPPEPASCDGVAGVAARLIAMGVFMALAQSPAAGQDEGWADGPRDRPGGRSVSVGFEVGKPLVFGVKCGYDFDSFISGHIGVARLDDFTAIGGEVRGSLFPAGAGITVPFAAAGLTQYFLSKDSRETSPTTLHVRIGAERIFLLRVGVSMSLGYQTALGSSEDRAVNRYGIHDDVNEWMFTVNTRLFF